MFDISANKKQYKLADTISGFTLPIKNIYREKHEVKLHKQSTTNFLIPVHVCKFHVWTI